MSDDMTCRSQRRRRRRRKRRTGEREGGFIQHPEMGKRNSKRQTRERERERYKDNRLPKQNNVVWNHGGYVQLVISRTGEARGTENKGRNEGEFTLKEKKHENTGVKKF